MSPQDKAPAYQWYVRDFMSDEAVALMSYEQQGIYRALLDRQWLEGSIPSDVEQLAAILRVPVAKFQKVWPRIAVKFSTVADGRLANARMEREREKADAYRELQRQKGLRSGQARTGRQPKTNHGSTAVDSRLEPKGNSSSASSSASASAPSGERAPASVVVPIRQPRSMGAMGSSPLAHSGHGRCNDRGVCMPQVLYSEILGRFGNDVTRFDAFYSQVLDTMPDDYVPTGSVFRFWHDMLERAHPEMTQTKPSPREAAMKAEW